MSLLSTFAILFETDADKAAKDTEDLDKALGGVEKSGKKTVEQLSDVDLVGKKVGNTMKDMAKDAVKLVTAYLAVSSVMDGIFGNAAQIDTLGKFSQTIGLNIVELDAWGAAVSRNGGSAEAFKGTVESLQTSLQDMEITGGGEIINTLAMIGVQATDSSGKIKSAFEILPDIADAFKEMSTQKSFAFGKKLGLDQGTILTLQQSRHEIGKLIERQKMLGGVTKEGYERAASFNDQWDDTKRVFNSLWMSANNTILPMLQNFFKGLERVVLWVKANRELVEGFFIGVAAAITAIYLPAITSAAAATLLTIAPFIAVGAAVAAVGVAIALLYEDIKAWVEGSSSAIGDIIGTFEEFKKKVTGIFDTISEKWKDFVKLFTDTKKEISDFLDLSNVLSGGIDIQQGLVQEGFNARLPTDTERAQAMIAHYSSTSLNHGGSVANQRTQNFNVNIGGASVDARGMTPQQATSTVNASMKQSVEMAIGQLSDGVER